MIIHELDLYALLTDIQRALDVMRAAGLDEGEAYDKLRRRMFDIEEKMAEPPY